MQAISGMVTQIFGQGFQIRDKMGMTINVSISGQTQACNFAQPPNVRGNLQEIRMGDIVICGGAAQGGGAFVASVVGFLHQGEQIHPQWQQAMNQQQQYFGDDAEGKSKSKIGKDLKAYGDELAAAPTDKSAEIAAIADPEGNFTLTIPRGWLLRKKSSDGHSFYLRKEISKGKATFTYKLDALAKDAKIIDFCKADEKTWADLGRQNPDIAFRNLGVKSLKLGPYDAAKFSYAYKANTGEAQRVDVYYVKAGTVRVTLFFATTKKSYRSFEGDFGRIVGSFGAR